MTYSYKIIQSFSEEVRELLSTLDFNLVRLEQDTQDKEIINEIFRMAHSIKSSSALMEMTLLSDTAHKIEDLVLSRDEAPVVVFILAECRGTQPEESDLQIVVRDPLEEPAGLLRGNP